MAESEEKKRKVSDEESDNKRRVSIKVEPVETPSTSAGTPGRSAPSAQQFIDYTKLSPVQKIFLEDLRSIDKVVVKQALKQLVAMCDSSKSQNFEKNRLAVAKFCGTAMIVAAMRAFIDSSDIQAEGCKALAYVAVGYGYGRSDIALFRTMKEAGALEAVVGAMATFPDEVRLQRLACFALTNLCDLEEHATHVVHHLNGHTLIVAAMKKFPYTARFQLDACWCLLNLSKWHALRRALIIAEGLEVLGAAIRRHQDESKECVKDIQSKCNRALNRLTKKPSNNSYSKPSSGLNH